MIFGFRGCWLLWIAPREGVRGNLEGMSSLTLSLEGDRFEVDKDSGTSGLDVYRLEVGGGLGMDGSSWEGVFSVLFGVVWEVWLCEDFRIFQGFVCV